MRPGSQQHQGGGGKTREIFGKQNPQDLISERQCVRVEFKNDFQISSLGRFDGSAAISGGGTPKSRDGEHWRGWGGLDNECMCVVLDLEFWRPKYGRQGLSAFG